MDAKVLQEDLESLGFTQSLAKRKMEKEVGKFGNNRCLPDEG